MEPQRGDHNEGLDTIKDAALVSIRTEAAKIVSEVISDLCGLSPSGIFGDDVYPRHLWDEYSWNIQEGPFDVPALVVGGTVEGAWDDLAQSILSSRVNSLPHPTLVLLTALAAEDNHDIELGSAHPDAVTEWLVTKLRESAAGRNLELIGPDRADHLAYETTWSGTVCSHLSEEGTINEIVSSYLDDLIEPDGDLNQVASDLADTYLDAVLNETDSDAASILISDLQAPIKALLIEQDIKPALINVREQLLVYLNA